MLAFIRMFLDYDVVRNLFHKATFFLSINTFHGIDLPMNFLYKLADIIPRTFHPVDVIMLSICVYCNNVSFETAIAHCDGIKFHFLQCTNTCVLIRMKKPHSKNCKHCELLQLF